MFYGFIFSYSYLTLGKLILLSRQFFKPVLLITAFLLSTVLFSCNTENSDASDVQRLRAANCDFNGIKTGDIVLKRGRGRISKMIVDHFKEEIPLSHCGVVICEKDSTFIVHSIAKGYAKKDGVQTILLNDFLNDCQAKYFYIVRQKTTEEKRQEFAQKAIEYSQKNIPFDDEANNDNPNEMSCTELIYWCQKETFGYSDLTSVKIANNNVFVFNALLDTSKYNIIKHY
jgi:hypothetical protein